MCITANGHRIPLHPTGINGEGVAGVRYRAWQPPNCLQPTIGVHAPLVFDFVDTWNRPLAGRLHLPCHASGRTQLRHVSGELLRGGKPAARAFCGARSHARPDQRAAARSGAAGATLHARSTGGVRAGLVRAASRAPTATLGWSCGDLAAVSSAVGLIATRPPVAVSPCQIVRFIRDFAQPQFASPLRSPHMNLHPTTIPLTRIPSLEACRSAGFKRLVRTLTAGMGLWAAMGSPVRAGNPPPAPPKGPSVLPPLGPGQSYGAPNARRFPGRPLPCATT